MAWDFDTDPEYQKVLDWADEFVREEIEPLDLAFPDQQYIPLDGNRRKIVDPLKDRAFDARRRLLLRRCDAVGGDPDANATREHRGGDCDNSHMPSCGMV